jgi:hypothetical protein
MTTLSNLAALLTRANVLVPYKQQSSKGHLHAVIGVAGPHGYGWSSVPDGSSLGNDSIVVIKSNYGDLLYDGSEELSSSSISQLAKLIPSVPK